MQKKKTDERTQKETGLQSRGRKNARKQPNSRIEGCLGELAGLKKPGETYDHLLDGIIELKSNADKTALVARILMRAKAGLVYSCVVKICWTAMVNCESGLYLLLKAPELSYRASSPRTCNQVISLIPNMNQRSENYFNLKKHLK